jgi:hypothetical protein
MFGGVTVPGSFQWTSTTIVPASGSTAEPILFTPTDNADYKTVPGTVTVVVNKVLPAITLVSSENPGLILNPVTFTATVTSTAGSPTGTVSFYDGTTLLGAVALSSGTSSYATSSLAAGTHSVTAKYSGDSNFVSATSSAVSEVVQDLILGTSSSGNTGSGLTVTAVPPTTITIPITIGQGDVGNVALQEDVELTASVQPEDTTDTTAFKSDVTVSFSQPVIPKGTVLPIVDDAFPQIATPLALAGGFDRRQRPQTPNRQIPPLVWGVLLLPFAAKLRRAGKRFARGTALLLVLAASAAAMLGLNGCNSSSGFFGQAPRTYIITITATAGNLSRSTTVTLIVE